MLAFIAFFLPLSLLCFALYTNKDLFTPAKFFIAYMFLFHFELVYVDYQVEFYLTYFSFLLLACSFVVYESTLKGEDSLENTEELYTKNTYAVTIFWLWILSFIPIIFQFYFIFISGGVVQYALDVIYRAEVWRGKGAILMVIQTMMILNLIYYSAGIYWKKNTKSWWFFFLIHFLITLMIGFLTGSRSVILMNLVFMTLIYNYALKKVKLRYLVGGMIFLIVSLTTLGLARNNFSWDADGITTGITASPDKLSIATSTFRAGLIPLTLVYSKKPGKIQRGTGLITPISNVVPRDIWPKKPDTASIAMNKQYVENRGLGPYEYPTGIIGLGIMNFGWNSGILFGFILLGSFFVFVEIVYLKHVSGLKKNKGFKEILLLIIGLYLIQTLPALVVGELANVLNSVILTKILPVFLFVFLIWLFTSSSKKLN